MASTFSPIDLEARQRLMLEKPHKPGNNGFGLCPHCGRPVHFVATNWLQPHFGVNDPRPAGFYRHNPRPVTRAIPDRERRFCSKCGKQGEWYTFKPGSGECVECQS